MLAAPFAVRTSLSDEVQPDVLVARFADLMAKNLPVAPVPAVEVASPSTSLSDRDLERAHDGRLGVPSYWLLGPADPGTIEVLELDGSGYYRPVASAQGDQEITVSRPFPVAVSPALLRSRPMN